MKRAWTVSVMVTLIAALTGCIEEPAVGLDGGSNHGDGGSHGDGSVVDSAVGPAGISVTGMGASEIAPGSRYEQVTLDGVPPFSSGVAAFQVSNVSGAALTIHSVALRMIGETEAIEWAINDPRSTSRSPLEVSEVALEADTAIEFGLHFQPIASGPRDVEVTIDYGDAQAFTFTVAARGRDNATLSPTVSNAFEHLFGRSNEANSNSLQPGGLGADPAGNLYFNVNVNGWDDRFGENLVLVRVDAGGELAWVRELQEAYPQEARDIGDNQEIGGDQDSIAVDSDANVYLAASRSASSTAAFQAFVMSVDGADGAANWATGLHTGSSEFPTTAAQVLRGQSVDASLSDRVLVAGQIADSSGAFLIALRKSDGSVLFAERFSIGGVHRVAGLAVDASAGTAYLGGIANNAPFLARIDGVASGGTPSLAWSRGYAPGFANVHSIALDGDGLLAAIDVRGASTTFLGVRIATSDGAVQWSRMWSAGSTDNNNAMTVAVHDGQAIFSGRIAFEPFDTQGGDGFLLSLDPATGSYNWGSFYYTGKGAETLVSDYVTGLVSTSAGLWVLHQVTPGSNNMHHFWGRWYQANDDTLDFPGGDGSMRLEDGAFTAMADAGASLSALAVNAYPTTPDTTWVDVTSSLEFEDPIVTEAEQFRCGTAAMLQRLRFSP